MSREAVVELFNRARMDAAIRARLENVTVAESYLEVGRQAGFEFSIDELRTVTHAELFYASVHKNPVLSRRFADAGDESAVVALAREFGFACEVEDLRAVLTGAMGGELDDVQLEGVTGGAWSRPDVCKLPSPTGPIPIPYPNL